MPVAVSIKIRKAHLGDVHAIYDLVNFFADREEMLHRSISEICENIRDYFVAVCDDDIIACCGLHLNLDSLAEIKSLAVSENFQGRGVGRKLVEACIEEACQLGVPSIFALTYQPGFFERIGFEQTPKSRLPRKIWGECIRCSKFPDCGEIAVIKVLRPEEDPFRQISASF